MTRARDALAVYFPLRFYRRRRGLDDAHSYAQLTRFVPEPVRSSFEERIAYLDDGGGGDPSFEVIGDRANGVERFLAGLWSE
jgi:hypothetical protein